MRIIQLIGGPADGAKMSVPADLKDLLVPCTIRPENERIGGPVEGFRCIALYQIGTATNGGVYFRFSTIQS